MDKKPSVDSLAKALETLMDRLDELATKAPTDGAALAADQPKLTAVESTDEAAGKN